jgi:hypothetical protein
MFASQFLRAPGNEGLVSGAEARTIGAWLRPIHHAWRKCPRSPIVIDVQPETPHQQAVPTHGSDSRALAATCSQHGAAGVTNLMVSNHDGTIMLDPHAAVSCVITLDEAAATALFDLLGEWPG